MATALSSTSSNPIIEQTQIQLSVITLSFHRADSLLLKLESLCMCNLNSEKFEVIIGFNDRDSALKKRIEELELPYQTNCLMFPENLGISQGRNACIEVAEGNIIYFSDDDCIPEKTTLTQHLEAQQHNPAVYIGSILFEDNASENAGSENAGSENAGSENAGSESNWEPKRVNYWNVNGANTSVPKDAIEAIQGFDESLQGYGGEDVLLGYKLRQYGLDFVALPKAWTTHIGPDPALSKNTDKAFSAGFNAVLISKQLPSAVAFRLGVHPILLRLKQLILNPLTTNLFKNSATLLYEKAYLDGALTADRDKTKIKQQY